MSIVHFLQQNTSGMTGVCWNRRHEKWRVTIGFGAKKIYLGDYADIHAARRRRLQAESYYGIAGGKYHEGNLPPLPPMPEDERPEIVQGHLPQTARLSPQDRWDRMSTTERKKYRKMGSAAPAWIKPFLAAARKAK